jgi:hypothetical protein
MVAQTFAFLGTSIESRLRYHNDTGGRCSDDRSACCNIVARVTVVRQIAYASTCSAGIVIVENKGSTSDILVACSGVNLASAFKARFASVSTYKTI